MSTQELKVQAELLVLARHRLDEVFRLFNRFCGWMGAVALYRQGLREMPSLADKPSEQERARMYTLVTWLRTFVVPGQDPAEDLRGVARVLGAARRELGCPA